MYEFVNNYFNGLVLYFRQIFVIVGPIYVAVGPLLLNIIPNSFHGAAIDFVIDDIKNLSFGTPVFKCE